MAVQRIEEGNKIKLTCDVCKKEIALPRSPFPLFRAVEINFKSTHARTCPDNKPVVNG